jgi:prepilin-type N-terminal cleavage/methylation domain-containing protein
VTGLRTTTGFVARTEAGHTLIEVLMAVAILGIGVVAIVAGMGTSIIGTDHHRKQAQAHTVLLSAVDAVKSQTANPYQACATAGTYAASSGVALPATWSTGAIAVRSVTYWDGTGFAATCPSPDSKLQLVEVEVSSPDGRATESVAVVKRNPS